MTTEYFNGQVTDDGSNEKREVHLEVGTTNFGGNGPQLYLNLDGAHVILSHEDAKAFCEGVAGVARYFQYDRT